jgi:hypothetical protein
LSPSSPPIKYDNYETFSIAVRVGPVALAAGVGAEDRPEADLLITTTNRPFGPGVRRNSNRRSRP